METAIKQEENDMEDKEKKAPICATCAYFELSVWDCLCTHTDAPHTDYVRGLKVCARLNYAGQCKLYAGKSEEEMKTPAGTIIVDLTLNAEPFKKKMAEILAGL